VCGALVRCYLTAVKTHQQRVSYGRELGGDDGQDGHVDAVELVEATPGTALAQTGEDLPDRLTAKHTTVNRQVAMRSPCGTKTGHGSEKTCYCAQRNR